MFTVYKLLIKKTIQAYDTAIALDNGIAFTIIPVPVGVSSKQCNGNG